MNQDSSSLKNHEIFEERMRDFIGNNFFDRINRMNRIRNAQNPVNPVNPVKKRKLL
jgi:hypothetical protein